MCPQITCTCGPKLRLMIIRATLLIRLIEDSWHPQVKQLMHPINYSLCLFIICLHIEKMKIDTLRFILTKEQLFQEQHKSFRKEKNDAGNLTTASIYFR